MPVAKNIDKKNALDLVEKLLVYFKYYHSPSIHYLHLIDIQFKSESHELLYASVRNLQNIICDLFKRCVEIKTEGLQSSPFTPVKVCNSGCTRCKNTFTICINQFKFPAPGFIQYRKDIIGKRFSDHPTINHLNIIDYSRKAYKFVPSSLIKKYESIICNILLTFFETQINICHPRQLPYILPKLVCVLKLLNLESISTTCLSFYSRLVDLIREKHYDEPLLLLEVWKSLLMSDQLIVGAFEKLTDHFPNHSKDKLKWVLVMASYLKFDLHGAWMRGNKLRNFSNCPVTSAMLSGNYEQMKTLLDYGFLPNSKPLARYNIYIRHLNRSNQSNCDFFPLGINFLVREILMFLIIRRNRSDETSLVTMMDKCFYLLWSFIPHPLITMQQLLEENAAIYSELPRVQSFKNVKRDLDELVKGYGDMSLDIGDDTTPRYLHHLSKCRIRHSLMVAGNLPHGVKQLPICKTLQEYMLVPEESVFNRS